MQIKILQKKCKISKLFTKIANFHALPVSKLLMDEGRLLEFQTVGRDQVQFWALTKDHKLEYFDVFVPRDGHGDPEQSFG